jgi:hypothetical protein
MSLKETLQKQNYDLIQGPIRNQDLLQVWIKMDFDQITIYRKSISKIFDQSFVEEPLLNEALSIVSDESETFDFSPGIDFVKNALHQFDIIDVDIEGHIKNGKSVTISYDNSYTKEFTAGAIADYLSHVTFDADNRSLQKQLHRDNLIVIAGVVFAKNLNVKIEATSDDDVGLETKLNQFGSAKFKIDKIDNHEIAMMIDSDEDFPIAIKAYRMKFRNDRFTGLKLVSDNRNFF